MPFAIPNSFTDGDILDAEDLNENQAAARKYLNCNIISGDITQGDITTESIVTPEFVGVTEDVYFQSGDVYSYRLAEKTAKSSDRRYHTATIKGYDPQTATRYVSVADLAKEIYLEDYGCILISIAFFALEANNDNDRAIYARGSTGSSNIVDSRYYLAVDGAVETETVAYAFEESGSGTTAESPTAQSIASGLTVSGGAQARKFISIYWMTDQLTPGYHTVQVLVDPRNEKGYVGQRMFTVETFYVGGFTPASNLTNAHIRSLEANTY